MTRLTPVLDKLFTRMRDRIEATTELDKFVSRMLALVKSDLDDKGCSLEILSRSFTDEGKELQLMIVIKFPSNFYDKAVSYILKVNKHGEMYKMSSGKDISTPLLSTPEQAADGFFAILGEVA